MKKTMVKLMSVLLALGLLGGCGAAGAAESVTAPETESVQVESVQKAMPAEPSVVDIVPPVEASSVEEADSVEEAAEETVEEADPEQFFMDYLEEPSVSEMYEAVAEKFEAREYVDTETGLTIPYNFYIPQEAAENPCPMVMFIADASVTGRDLSAPLMQGYGGIIWATETEQAKHPSYVLVPEYPEVAIDDNSGEYVSDYVEATARMVEAVAAENNVDMDRIYTTGQSMGCMMSLYMASSHPDLFAAELFVSGQWNVEQLQNLDSQTFFYVAAGGDPKASAGQANVIAMLQEKGAAFSESYEWDANLGDADMEEALRAIIAEGSAMNIGQFAAGTVTEANNRGMEHMSSFDCAYKLDVLRNWLFAQHK